MNVCMFVCVCGRTESRLTYALHVYIIRSLLSISQHKLFGWPYSAARRNSIHR